MVSDFVARQRGRWFVALGLLGLTSCLDPIGPGLISDLPHSGRLEGTILHLCNKHPPIEGALVQLLRTGPLPATGAAPDRDAGSDQPCASCRIREVRSDAQGRFAIDDLSAGEYNATVDKDNFEVQQKSVQVQEGQSATLNVKLFPRNIAGPGPFARLDVLLVVDNSNSMAEEQQNLAAAMSTFLDTLSRQSLPLDAPLPNNPPQGKQVVFDGDTRSFGLDVRFGVTTTDLGAGNYQLPSCERKGGDGGRLQVRPECPRIVDGKPYLSVEWKQTYTATVDPADAAHIARWQGSPATLRMNVDPSELAARDPPSGETLLKNNAALGRALGCMVQLGTGGCGFEQPLAAAQKALDGKTNPGFPRTDADVAIIIFSDEDDCSAKNETLFDPSDSATLGPLTSFRCFRFGVSCAETDLSAPGTKQGCHPATNSPYVADPLTHQLAILGDRQESAFLAVIAGPPTPVVVSSDGAYPILGPSCGSTTGQAAPAVRLQHATEIFPSASFDSICSPDLHRTLQSIASQLVSTTLASPCK